MTDQRTIEAALRRQSGASEAHKARIYQENFATADDLYTTCQGCQRQRKGTLQQLTNDPCECGHAKAD